MSQRFSMDFWKNRSGATNTVAFKDVPLNPSTPLFLPQQRAVWTNGPFTSDEPNASAPAAPRHALFIPENYEANYAYPLIIWLHGTGRTERELFDVLPRISPHNYIGVAFRGNQPGDSKPPAGFRWPQSDRRVGELESQLHGDVCDLRRSYHIHSERIFLAGADEGATLALRLLLGRPEWFAGAILLGGEFPRMKPALHRYRDLRGKRVFIGAGRSGIASDRAGRSHFGRLLHAAGLEVTAHAAEASGSSQDVFPAVNRWLMHGLFAIV